MIRSLPVLVAGIVFLVQPGWGASHPKKRVRRPPPAPVLSVTPSRDIETQLVAEVARAENILNELRPDNALDSPYLLCAVYYHDGILDRFEDNKAEADPASRVVARITRMLTPERKQVYIDILRTLSKSSAAATAEFVLPVAWSQPQNKRGRWQWRAQNHKNAIDMFVREGSPVNAAAAGLVVLADANWQPDQPFSSSSLRGGNAVIVFSAADNRFYRYCHLEKVMVQTGAVIAAGQQIGTVGHTGFNASRPGHGGRLHFEINEYNGGAVTALTDKQLRAWLVVRSKGP